MKKLLLVAVLMCALVGCGTQEQPVFETIGQVDCQKPELPAPGMIEVYLPEEAAAQTMSDDGVEVTAGIITRFGCRRSRRETFLRPCSS